MRFLGRTVAASTVTVTTQPIDIKRLTRYRDQQPPGHFDDVAGAAVLELLNGFIGAPDPDAPPPPATP